MKNQKKQDSSIETSKEIELPKIIEEGFNSNEDNSSVRTSSMELGSTQLKFVNNESQVLIFTK